MGPALCIPAKLITSKPTEVNTLGRVGIRLETAQDPCGCALASAITISVMMYRVLIAVVFRGLVTLCRKAQTPTQTMWVRA